MQSTAGGIDNMARAAVRVGRVCRLCPVVWCGRLVVGRDESSNPTFTKSTWILTRFSCRLTGKVSCVCKCTDWKYHVFVNVQLCNTVEKCNWIKSRAFKCIAPDEVFLLFANRPQELRCLSAGVHEKYHVFVMPIYHYVRVVQVCNTVQNIFG